MRTPLAMLLCLLLPPLGAADLDHAISSLVPAAEALRIDGYAQDWRPFHAATTGNNRGERHKLYAINFLQVAPTADHLAICATGYQPFSRAGGAFWFKLDVAGDARPDFILGCYWKQAHILDVIAEDGRRQRVELDGIEGANVDMLELRIPWSALEAAVPEDLREAHALTRSGVRSWIRVHAESWSYARREHVCRDRGLAVASPLLLRTPRPLDPPPAMAGEPIAMRLPLDGRWYCSQAADGWLSHRGAHAYDFIMVDISLRDHPGVVEADGELSDRYAYGKPVRAGVAGTVIATRDGQRDSPLGSVGADAEDNVVGIAATDGSVVGFGHLRPNSVCVRRGEVVDERDLVGAIGNSGASNAPHLHLTATGADGATRPIALQRVTVSLNPVPDDPWRRKLETWIPRDGFFVQNLP